MTTDRKRTCIIGGAVLSVGLLLSSAANAQLPTFDSATFTQLAAIWKQNISTYAKMVAEFNQLVKIYTNGMQLYASAMYMRSMFSSGLRGTWLMTGESVMSNVTQSRYNETIKWPAMVNGQPSLAPVAWASATVPMSDTGVMMSGMNSVMAQRLAADIATAEIADGASVHCLQTIAQHNSLFAGDIAALKALGVTFHSDSPTTNSLIQQLNLQNGAAQQAATQAMRQAATQNCVVEQQAVANKALRDQTVMGVNQAVETQATVSAAQNAWDGDSPWNVRLP